MMDIPKLRLLSQQLANPLFHSPKELVSWMGVVMISLEEYNSLKETEYIMSSEQTMNDIRKGEEDLKAGKGKEVNLDEL